MHVSNQKSLHAGLLFTAVGTAFALVGQTYGVGTAVQMGAGYFPVMLGVLLAIVGIVISIKSVSLEAGPADGGDPIRLPHIDWVVAAIVISSVFFFAFAVIPLGLVVTTIGTVLIARLASRPIFGLDLILTVGGLTIVTVVVFKLALGVQLPLWPEFAQ